jgi:hypothetical protein
VLSKSLYHYRCSESTTRRKGCAAENCGDYTCSDSDDDEDKNKDDDDDNDKEGEEDEGDDEENEGTSITSSSASTKHQLPITNWFKRATKQS